MKTIKRFLLPIIVGIISSAIPTIVGFEIGTWQYWLISLSIIVMSWVVYPLDAKINNKGNGVKNSK